MEFVHTKCRTGYTYACEEQLLILQLETLQIGMLTKFHMK